MLRSRLEGYEIITVPLTKGVASLIKHIFPNAEIDYRPRDKIAIYKYKGRVIGFIHYGIRKGKGAIVGLGVLNKYRKKGHARFMLMNALSDMKISGVDRVLVKVNPSNEAAFSLYTTMGFEPVRRLSKSMVLMRRFYEEN